jgi:hypothetical protein
VATALSVDTTVGLPGSTPFTLLLDAGSAAEEIVTVIQVSGNTLVVQRGQDGTSAQPHANGAVIRHALTARDLRESREHEAAVAAHGVTSKVVGTDDAQALTNKNLAATSNVFPSTLATSASLSAETTARVAGDAAQGTALTTHTALVAAHGATGAVVGTTNVQTLTNKTLDSPQFTGTMTGTGDVVTTGKVTGSNVGDDTGLVTAGFVALTGWSQTSNFRTKNGVTTVQFRFTRTGAAIVSSANANVADTPVLTIPAAAQSGSSVSVCGGIAINLGGSAGWFGVLSGSTLTITTAMNPNLTWSTGSTFYATVTYII